MKRMGIENIIFSKENALSFENTRLFINNEIREKFREAV